MNKKVKKVKKVRKAPKKVAKTYVTPRRAELDKIMLAAIRRGTVDDLDLYERVKQRPAVVRGIKFPKRYRIPQPEKTEEQLREANRDVYVRFEDCDLRGIIDFGPIDGLLYCKNCDLRGKKLGEFSYYRLKGCDLREACVRGLYLSEADWIEGCDLRGTYGWDDLGSTWICCGKRTMKELSEYIPMACPKEGAYTGYKCCQCMSTDRNLLTTAKVVVVLEIPAKAKRSSSTGRKCRASEAFVKAIWGYATTGKRIKLSSAVSTRDPDFIYHVGETVRPVLPFCENRFSECASGIHHFMTYREAKEYPL